MEQGKLLDLQGVAARTGMTYNTVRWYHNTATKNRKEGKERPGDLPTPDQDFPRKPLWYEATIDTWLANRPGRGAGGGRPPKNPTGQ